MDSEIVENNVTKEWEASPVFMEKNVLSDNLIWDDSNMAVKIFMIPRQDMGLWLKQNPKNISYHI